MSDQISRHGIKILLPIIIIFIILTGYGTADVPILGMDPSVDPGDDFFRYANGEWIDSHPVPANLRMYSAVNEVTDRVDERIRLLIEESANESSYEEGSTESLIGTFYRSAMNISLSNETNIDPVLPLIASIESSETREEIKNRSVDLLTSGLTPFFTLYAGEDHGDEGMLIMSATQSGLSFPSRDFYLSDDPEISRLRDEFRNYAVRIFTLAGYPNETAEKYADAAIRIENLLASQSGDPSGYGRTETMYFVVNRTNLSEETPGVPWDEIFTRAGREDIPKINIQQPEYMKEVGRILDEEPIEDIRAFLIWKILQFAAPLAGSSYREEYSNFYEKTLAGQTEQTPWWKMVVAMINEVLGNALGRAYVDKYFPESDKETAEELMDNLHSSLEERVQNVPWLLPQTKEVALDKINSTRMQVGYPDQWGDLSGMNISDISYLENILNISKFYFNLSMLAAGNPSNPDTWFVSPQTVNAYYDTTRNSIVVPAGILQEPFFSSNADPAMRYGAFGAMIGHEMIHGIDEVGRKYDKNGTLGNWWTRSDIEGYAINAFPLVPQYSRTETLPGLYLNGTRTISENVADLGGLTIAYHAYMNTYPDEANITGKDGLTGKQRFFISFAQAWRGTIREEELRNLVLVESHPWNEYRVNLVPFNMDEFYEVFPEIGPDDELYIPPENRSHLW